MDSFKNYLNENSFYTVQKEKDDFINNDKLVINAFFFSFIMPLGFLDSAKNNDKVKLYFRGDQKLKIDNINDNNNDNSLIIKIMSDKGFFKSPQTSNEITRFLVKVKSGQVTSVDEKILRGWIEQIKADKLVGSSAVVKKLTKAFLDGGSLGSFADGLKANAKVTRWKQLEFYDTAKVLRIDPAKKRAAPASAATDSKPGAVDTPSTAPTSVATPAPSTRGRKTSKPAGKVAWSDTDTMISEFARGTDIDASYKHTAKNREEFLKDIAKRYKDGLLDDKDVNPMIEFLKKFPMSQNKVQDAILGTVPSGGRYSYRSPMVSKGVLSIVKSNFFELFDKGSASKAVKAYLKSIVNSIMGDLTELVSPKDMEEFKNSYSAFFQSNIVQNNQGELGKYGSWGQGDRWKIFNAFMFSKTDEDFLSNLLNARVISKNSSGGYTYNFDKAIKSQQGHMGSLDLIRSKGVQQPSRMEEVVDYISRNSQIAWDMVEVLIGDDKDEFYKWLNSLPKAEYDEVAVKGLYSSDNADQRWHPTAIKDFIENISPEVLIKNSIAVRSTFYRIDIKDKLKSDVATLATKRILNHIATADLAKIIGLNLSSAYGSTDQYFQSIDNLYDLASQYNLLTSYKSTLADVFIEGVKNLIKLKEKNRFVYITASVNSNPGSSNNYKDNILSNKQIEELDLFLIQYANNKDLKISGPVSLYSDMSSSNKKLIQSIVKDKGRAGLEIIQPIADEKFFDTLSTKDIVDTLGSPGKIYSFLSEKSRKPVIMNLLKDESFRQSVVDVFKQGDGFGSHHRTAVFLNILSESEDVNVQLYDKIATSFVNGLEKDSYGYSSTMAYLSNQENFNNKSKVIYEKLLLSADTNMNKMKTEYRDFMTSAQDQFTTYVGKDRKGAEFLYQNTSKSMKRRLAGAYMNSTDFSTSAKEALANPDSPIKPFEKLTDKRIKEILRYNNVVSEETKISDKHIRDFAAMDMYLRTEAKNRKPIEDLQVEEVKMTAKELNQLTADMHRTKRNERHGREGMIIKRSFNVAIPLQIESQKEWIEKNPNQEIINPMYHGTGSIAASMILRYGFRVVKSGDPSVVGRMLGDGVYGAIHIDKSQQYVGDAGFSRRAGTKGYIFEMNAALGEQGTDYKAAGVGGRDGIRSPEWCVFTPNSQFKIFKAHEIEIVNEYTMKKILDENPPSKAVREFVGDSGLGFKDFLKESVGALPTNYTSYTFVNGLIPRDHDNMIDFEEFKSPNPDMISLEPSAYGPSVVIRGTEETNDYIFTGPSDFAMNHPEIFAEYLNYLKKK